MVPAIPPVSNWPTAGAADTSSITSNVSSAPTVRDPDPSKRMHLALTCIDIELEIIFLPPEQTLLKPFFCFLFPVFCRPILPASRLLKRPLCPPQDYRPYCIPHKSWKFGLRSGTASPVAAIDSLIPEAPRFKHSITEHATLLTAWRGRLLSK
jgi:hypothetical protein